MQAYPVVSVCQHVHSVMVVFVEQQTMRSLRSLILLLLKHD